MVLLSPTSTTDSREQPRTKPGLLSSPSSLLRMADATTDSSKVLSGSCTLKDLSLPEESALLEQG